MQQLLRGSSLRNTEYIYGLAVYTGHQSKIMMNSSSSRVKQSKIEKLTNRLIIVVFFTEVALCLFAGIYASVWFIN
jgi:phospholipid-transporting ATPase